AFRPTRAQQHRSRSVSAYQDYGARSVHAFQGRWQYDEDRRSNGLLSALQDFESRSIYALEHAGQGQHDVERRRKEGVEFRRRSRVGR
ncbi:hypothetical protein A2U01_0083063, partial [Trifolium medium]|nr:hypothetical protein [Trifolium medium]